MATAHPIPTHPLFQDLTELQLPFSSWTILSYAGKRGTRHCWNCRCKCGQEAVVRGAIIKSGQSRQCRLCANRACRTHGGRHTPEYTVWRAMIQRCEDQNQAHYHRYGGRGIKICERWRNSFETFLEDMGPRPSKKHSLDRFPDNDGDYEPGNVRWATDKQQARNRRSNRLLTLNGKTQCIAAWAEERGIKQHTIIQRLRRGCNDETALA